MTDAHPAHSSSEPVVPQRRRVRYRGTHPRRFKEKYKELRPDRYPETVAKVLASGKTPAGTHRPIMVEEILEVLEVQVGEIAVDCTLGYGGHALELLQRVRPSGRVLGMDVDPIELPKAEARLRALGFGPELFLACRSNFAGLPKMLAEAGLPGADVILADLGVSSMQLDDLSRGFSMKQEGPLDMRMNPFRGQPVSTLLARVGPDKLATILADNADEPDALRLATALAGRSFSTTRRLVDAIHAVARTRDRDAQAQTVRRVFQALRIAVNDEFSSLEAFLRELPSCLNPGGRVAVLTFHSGEDRRVKKAFEAGLRTGAYGEIAQEIRRPSAAEQRANPRSAPAKLRWARRGPARAVAQ